jgi:Cdc6-like AAA superfamily ATPase
MIQHALNGYNTTILCYGQTGSGKTYTASPSSLIRQMQGPTNGANDTEKRGLIHRTLEVILSSIKNQHLFKHQLRVNKVAENIEYTTAISYMEIYNEKVHDLLNLANDTCIVRGGMVEGATVKRIKSLEEALAFIEIGLENRRTAETNK